MVEEEEKARNLQRDLFRLGLNESELEEKLRNAYDVDDSPEEKVD